MARKFIGVDPDSGVVIDIHEVDDHGQPKKPKAIPPSDLYLMLYLPGLRRLAGDTSLTGTDYRVLLEYLTIPAPNTEEWATDHTRIARKLGVTTQQVQKSTGKLVARGHLLRKRHGRLQHNVLLSWRGGSTRREELKRNLLAD